MKIPWIITPPSKIEIDDVTTIIPSNRSFSSSVVCNSDDTKKEEVDQVNSINSSLNHVSIFPIKESELQGRKKDLYKILQQNKELHKQLQEQMALSLKLDKALKKALAEKKSNQRISS